MSEHSIIPEDISVSSSASMRSEDSDSSKASAMDSLNSLLKNSSDTECGECGECGEECLDVKIKCEGEEKSKRRICCSEL